MQVEPQIAFEGFEPAEHVRSRVSSEIEKLEEFFQDITSCRVVVKATPGRRQHGDLYEVSIHLVLPGGREVVANRHPAANHAHEDVLVTIRDAFKAARRQLQDEARKLRGDVKQPAGPPLATVKALVAEQDYGFLETGDRREIYFHRNSVTNGDFDKLRVGDTVSFHESLGDKGPQASTVHLLGKHGMRPVED